MNQTIHTLKSRCSTKKYLDQPVPEDLLDAVLEAGLYAPSGMNNQKVVAVAVRDKNTRDQLSRMNADIMGAGLDPFYNAPCVIVVLADPERNTWVEDGSLVMGNLMNAATAAGSTGQERCSTPRRERNFCANGVCRKRSGVWATAF